MVYFMIRFGLLKAWQFVLAGAGVGGIAVVVLFLLDQSLNFRGLIVIIMPMSAIIALLVWAIGVKNAVMLDSID